MNNLQFYFAMGLPTLTVLLGIFMNQRVLDHLGHRMDLMEKRMDRMETALSRIEADLREFYRVLGQHDARLDNLEKGRA